MVVVVIVVLVVMVVMVVMVVVVVVVVIGVLLEEGQQTRRTTMERRDSSNEWKGLWEGM